MITEDSKDSPLRVTIDELCAADHGSKPELIARYRLNRYGLIGNWDDPLPKRIQGHLYDQIYPVEKNGRRFYCLCGELAEIPASGRRADARFTVDTLVKALINSVTPKKLMLIALLNRGHCRVTLSRLRTWGLLLLAIIFPFMMVTGADGAPSTLVITTNLVYFFTLFYLLTSLLPRALQKFLLYGIASQHFVPRVPMGQIRREIHRVTESPEVKAMQAAQEVRLSAKKRAK